MMIGLTEIVNNFSVYIEAIKTIKQFSLDDKVLVCNSSPSLLPFLSSHLPFLPPLLPSTSSALSLLPPLPSLPSLPSSSPSSPSSPPLPLPASSFFLNLFVGTRIFVSEILIWEVPTLPPISNGRCNHCQKDASKYNQIKITKKGNQYTDF